MVQRRVGRTLFRFLALAAAIIANSAHADSSADTVQVELEPLITQAAQDPARFAVELPHRRSLDDAGTWTSIPGGLRWNYSVRVPTAVSLSVHAFPVVLPQGATLTVKGSSASFTYTARDVGRGELWSRVLRGDTLDIELTVPAAARGKARFQIAGLQAGFRGLGAGTRNHPVYDRLRAQARAKPGVKFNAGSITASAGSGCMENYTCSVTAGNTGPSHSTVGLLIANLVQCTGVLLGNERHDGTPFVLTARHCQTGAPGGGQPFAAAAVTVYWNATSPCVAALGNLYDPAIPTQTGAMTVVEQQDAWLIKLERDPVIPAPFYAGFDATGGVINGGYSIHHALSTKQQIVEWFGQAVPLRLPGAELGVSYETDLWAVSSQKGYFGPGASGSALFDENDRLVGIASLARISSDGPGVCAASPPTVPTETDADGYFTSLAALWRATEDRSSTTGAVTLASILDPDNTGARVVNGASGLSRVAFTASAQTLAINSNLTLNWSAAGATSCEAGGGLPGDAWSGTLAAQGSIVVTSATVTEASYRIACTYPDGRVGRSTLSIVWTVVEPFGYFGGYQTARVWLGSPYVIGWSANTQPCAISTATPTGPGTDQLTGLSATGSATLVFSRVGEGQLSLKCGPGGGTQLAGAAFTVIEPDVEFFANATDRVVGQPLNVIWYSIAKYCTPSGGAPDDGWSISQRGGDASFQPRTATVGTFTYRLTCEAGAVSVERAVTVRVSNDAPYASLQVSPTTLQVGSRIDIRFKSNIDNCYLAGSPGSGGSPIWVSAESNWSVTVSNAGAFTLQVSCSNNGLQAVSQPVTVTVTAPVPLPTVTLNASASSLQLGQSVTVDWSSENAVSCVASGDPAFNGAVLTADSRTITPTTAGQVVLIVQCTGGDGRISAGNVTIAVNAPAPPSGGGSSGSGSSGGGGGGAVDLVLAVLLGGFALVRARTLKSAWLVSCLFVLSAALSFAPAVPAATTYADAVSNYQDHDLKAGAAALQELANAGDARAQFFLGSAQLTGSDGIPMDRAQGYAWLQIAASSYFGAYGLSAIDDARKAMLEVGPKLSGSELIRAEQISAAFLAEKHKFFSEQWHDALEVVMGRTPALTRPRLPGCAVDPTLHHCSIKGLASMVAPSCVGNAVEPDVQPKNVGPLARLAKISYPRADLRSAKEGGIIVLAHLDRSGFVCYATLVLSSGSDAMDDAALQSIRVSRLQPGLKDGQAVESMYTQRFDLGITEYQLRTR